MLLAACTNLSCCCIHHLMNPAGLKVFDLVRSIGILAAIAALSSSAEADRHDAAVVAA